MKDKLSKLFKEGYVYPEINLSDDVWRAIQIKQSKSLRNHAVFYSSISFLSLTGFVLLMFSISKELNTSGFFHYASLVFSDGSLLATYWKEYLLSLADSLPMASLGASFFLLFSMLVSSREAFNQYRSKLLIN